MVLILWMLIPLLNGQLIIQILHSFFPMFQIFDTSKVNGHDVWLMNGGSSAHVSRFSSDLQ